MNKDILKAKLEKLANFKSAGIDPYPEKTNRSFTNNDALKKFSSIKKSIFLVGRIRSIREMGNVSFAHIQDETGKIQILPVSSCMCANETFPISRIDLILPTKKIDFLIELNFFKASLLVKDLFVFSGYGSMPALLKLANFSNLALRISLFINFIKNFLEVFIFNVIIKNKVLRSRFLFLM